MPDHGADVPCVFCELLVSDSANWVVKERDAVAFSPLAKDALAPGHTLVVPRRHAVNILDVEPGDLNAAIALVQQVSRAMLSALGASGVNLRNASGPHTGQSVWHLHFHVIPRWADDEADMLPVQKSVHRCDRDPYTLLAETFRG